MALYLLTVAALAGLVGRTPVPKTIGEPYDSEVLMGWRRWPAASRRYWGARRWPEQWPDGRRALHRGAWPRYGIFAHRAFWHFSEESENLTSSICRTSDLSKLASCTAQEGRWW